MNKFITSAKSLVTTHDQTRAGFLAIALEKNIVGDPYIKDALAFKTMTAHTSSPDDFLNMPQIRPFMLTASGLSEKSLQYLTEHDQTIVIKELIEKFLKPSGSSYIDETIYRYLLTKGDAVGGIMRNRIGEMGQEKLIRCILSCMNVRGIIYEWLDRSIQNFIWRHKQNNDLGIEKKLKAIQWKNNLGKNRILGFNMIISIVKKKC